MRCCIRAHRTGRRHRQAGHYAERIWVNLIKYQYEGGLSGQFETRTIWGVPCTRILSACRQARSRAGAGARAFAVQVIRDAAAAGARSATIVTSGFSELQDADSQKLAAELQQAVRETGMAVTGPNCLGISVPGKNCSPTSTTASSRWKRGRSRSPANPARS